MTLALKYGNKDDPESEQGLIYFDAVTQLAKTYSGQVTSHPIANGAVINDHYVRENPVFKVQAVISGVDITTWTSLLRGMEEEAVYNYYSNTPVSIDEGENFSSIVPESISQFFQREAPNIQMDKSRTDITEQVEAMLVNLMTGFVEDRNTGQVKTNIQTVSLYTYDGLLLKSVIDDLVITNLTFTENAQTGAGLFFELTLSKVSFVDVILDRLPQSVVNSLNVSESSKGNQDSTPQDMESNDPNKPKKGISYYERQQTSTSEERIRESNVIEEQP